MIFLPQRHPEPIWPPRAESPNVDAILLPILGGLSGAIMLVLVALLVGPHWLELALPLLGLLSGRLVSTFD